MPDRLTKVIRLEILKPKDGDWKTAAANLRTVQAITARALNDCIREYYLEAAPKCEELKQRGEKVSASKVKGKQSMDPYLRKRYGSVLNSYAYDTLANVARQRWNEDWFDVLVRGSKSLPSYRSDCPIFLRATGVQIGEQIEGQYTNRWIALKLRPKVDSRVPEEVFLLRNDSFDDSRKAIWDRLISGQYKLGLVQILFHARKKKWFVNISYSFEPEIIEDLDPNIVVGVDLGISVPVYLAVNNGFVRAALREEGETITAFRQQLDRRRRALRRNERGILERRSGHGRAHKIESIEKLRELEDNFRRTANHRLSKAVINFTLQQQAGRIVMENLEGFREEKIQSRVEDETNGGNRHSTFFLEQWSTFELQTMIEQKAREHGVVVSKVKPAYTSQRCSKCGHIDKANRPTQERFKCVKCGLSLNADYNAARNLATPEIEKLIDITIKDGTRMDQAARQEVHARP